MLPFLEVSHLPSSSSFYSAVVQPLGLQYLFASSIEGAPTVTFGTRAPLAPAFEIREIRPGTTSQPLKLSRIVFSAGAPDTVQEFWAFAIRAYPDSVSQPHGLDSGHGEDLHAKVKDLDGNEMEVAYVPPHNYPSEYAGSTLRRTQSTHDEVSRILDWNYGVAASAPRSQASESAMPLARRPYEQNPGTSVLRRSVTTTSMLDPMPSPREGSKGLSTASVVGLLGAAAVGAAAGAAVTYSMIKSNRGRAERGDFEAPTFQRRATFPDPYPGHGNRVVRVEETTERGAYPEDYAPIGERRPPPTRVARYSQVGIPRQASADGSLGDSRGLYSLRDRTASSPGVRTRSEAPAERETLLLTDAEHRSFVGSKHGTAQLPRSTYSTRRSSYGTGEQDTYVSAKSRRSSSTLRAPPPLPPPGQSMHSIAPSRSRASSRATTATMRIPAAAVDQPYPGLERAKSYISAHNVPLPSSVVSAHRVPLPRSRVGSSHADWDDDTASVAPSDSISNIGSRRSAHFRR